MRKLPGIKIPVILLLSYPFIEIFGFILVFRWLGFAPTVLLFVMTTMLGSFLLRKVSLLKKRNLISLLFIQPRSVFVMFAAFLLMLPGFVTDLIGLLLLLQPLQSLLIKRVTRKKTQNSYKRADNQYAKGRTFEGEFWREGDKNQKK